MKDVIKDYKDLRVWQKAMEVVSDVITLVGMLPSGPASRVIGEQIIGSSTSVCANIAEGHSRWYTKEFLHQLSISYGSLAELETQLIIAIEVKIIDRIEIKSILEQIDEIGKMINGLRNKLRAKP